MAVAETALGRPVASRRAPHAEPPTRAPRAKEVDRPATPLPSDDDAGIVGLAVGSGILVIQACAIIPGLLPCLLLLLPFVLPVFILSAAAGLVVGVPLGIWWLVTSLAPRRGSIGGSVLSETQPHS